MAKKLVKKQKGGKTSAADSIAQREAFFSKFTEKREKSKDVYTPSQIDSVNFARKIKNSPITKAKENITKPLKKGGQIKSKKK